MSDSRTTTLFTGFSPEGFAFLAGLAENQSKEWFEAHKAVYDTELKAPMAALLGALGFAFQVHEIPLSCDPKRAIFRIHRDVRFSKDKRPYKTHIGASMTRSGEKLAAGLVYIHIDPTGCFVAGGCYRPEPPVLHKLRLRMRERSGEILQIAGDLADRGLVFDDEEALKKTPRGFEDVLDEDLLALLRLKSLIVRQAVDAEVARDGNQLVDRIVTFVRQVHPLLRFIWQGIL